MKEKINKLTNENKILIMLAFYSISIGLFFAGIVYNYGIRYILGLSAFFMLFQITFQNTLIYMSHHPKEGD